jgi:hypothetical protein
MAARRQLEFFVLRYVPSAVKGEFVNFGVVMFEPGSGASGFADARFARNWERVRLADPQVDIEILEELENDIRSRLGKVRDREALLRTMEDSFSNIIQLSPKAACLCDQPELEIEEMARMYLEAPRPARARQRTERERIVERMDEAFERAGVLKLLMRRVPVSVYTKAGDPLKFDFGYRVGNSLKFFHAVPLKTTVDQALLLSSRYPLIAAGVRQIVQAEPFLTAVVHERLDRSPEPVQFALAAFEEQGIRVATTTEMPGIADIAARELLRAPGES